MIYLDIIDSLSVKRVDEGMIDSISKNSSSGSGDRLLKALLDCDVYLESVYSKLRLPTLGCRFKIEFASKDVAKDFYKKIRGIGVEKWVNSVKVMSDTIVLECF